MRGARRARELTEIDNLTDECNADSPRPDGPILYLTGGYPRASHTFILREVMALRRAGLDVRTASVRFSPPSELIGPEEEAAQAETFHVLRAARNPFRLVSDHVAALLAGPGRYARALILAARTGRPGLAGGLKQAAYFLEAAVLARHMAREGISHLHNHFADSSANLAMIAAEMAGRPFSLTLHGPAELFEPQSWRLDAKTARARFTVAISSFARAQAMLFSERAHWQRIHVVHCGVEPERYTNARSAPGGPTVELLFVGRLTAIKGVFVLLDALQGMPCVRLTLVGDGEDRASLEEEARRRDLQVRFLGYQSQIDVTSALAQADALVLPSFAEGVPVVLMEAMASGRPVIAPRVGGVEELVEDGVSGIITPAGDASALRDAIAQLIAMPAEARAAMGEAGRAKVAAEFNVDIEARRLMALFCGTAEPGEVRPQPNHVPCVG